MSQFSERESDEAMLTSGQFGRRAHLSIKALRIYHEMGLLTPEHVDPDNGYRYYSERQVPQARLIGLLRRLDMPLNDIAIAVELDRPEVMKAVAEHWQSLQAEHHTKRELVRYLTDHLTSKGQAMFKVETRSVPQQRVASIQSEVLAPGLPQFIGDSLGALYGHLHDEQAKPGVSYVIYHGEVNLDAAGPVEVCVPYDGQVAPAGEIRLRVEAAHDVAYTRISKRQVEFPGILEAYDAVGCWAAESERGIAGPPREIYIVDWDRAELDDLACDVAFPLG